MDNDVVKVVIFYACVMALIYIVWAAVDRQRCYAKWSDEFEPKWGVFSNCIITVDGVRIPSENYRDF